MARKTATATVADETPEKTPEEQAAADKELAEFLDTLPRPATEPEPPQEETVPTIADRFVGMADLIQQVKQRTRLNEGTLTKLMEVALQYHAWDTQQRAQQQQSDLARYFQGNGSGDESDEGLVGPEPHEIIGAATEDNEPETVNA